MILYSCTFTLDGFFVVLVTFLAQNIEVSHNPLQNIRLPQVPTNRSFNVSCKTDLMTAFTSNTSIVIAVISDATVDIAMPSPCSASSHAISVKAFQWRTRSDHVTRKASAARNNAAYGQGNGRQSFRTVLRYH